MVGEGITPSTANPELCMIISDLLLTDHTAPQCVLPHGRIDSPKAMVNRFSVSQFESSIIITNGAGLVDVGRSIVTLN
jgi:hypothetical protein